MMDLVFIYRSDKHIYISIHQPLSIQITLGGNSYAVFVMITCFRQQKIDIVISSQDANCFYLPKFKGQKRILQQIDSYKP